jgi:uncharacterized membrane protein YeaQ/YmgE (transglycosylase-associated protein family)
MTMTVPALLLYLVVAAICGAVGKAIAGDARGGLVVSIFLGFIGAVLGPWIAHQLKLSEPLLVTISGHPIGILWAVIGAAVFVALLHLLSRQHGWRYGWRH